MSTQSDDETFNDLSTLMFNNLGFGTPNQDEKWEVFLKLVDSHNSLCRSYERLLTEVESDDDDDDSMESSSSCDSDDDDTKEEDVAHSEDASKDVGTKEESEALVQPPV